MMLKDLLRTIKAVVVLFGVLLGFFAVLEVIRAFQTLYSLHPIAGFLFLLVLAGGGVWLGVWFVRTVRQSPGALKPPAVGEIEQADSRQLGRWAKYQIRFCQRLLDNPALDANTKQKVQSGLDSLKTAVASGTELPEKIKAVETEAIMPAIETLDKQANRQVRDCVRDVMLAVTLSPYKSVDLFIVLYRNVMMVGRIIRTYNNRPTLGQSIRIGLDVLNIVATVNYINMGKNLIEALASRLPGIGKLTDDIAQGIGAGFMTSIAGHAAIDRCRAFRRWNAQQAKAGLMGSVGDFYSDVRDIFFADVWGFVKLHSGQATDQVKDTIYQALDQVAQTLGQCVLVPVKAVGTAGQTIASSTVTGARAVKDFLAKPFTKEDGRAE
jgi:uncharacterized membrane protein YcjF (UPF0283 family)